MSDPIPAGAEPSTPMSELTDRMAFLEDAWQHGPFTPAIEEFLRLRRELQPRILAAIAHGGPV